MAKFLRIFMHKIQNPLRSHKKIREIKGLEEKNGIS